MFAGIISVRPPFGIHPVFHAFNSYGRSVLQQLHPAVYSAVNMEWLMVFRDKTAVTKVQAIRMSVRLNSGFARIAMLT